MRSLQLNLSNYETDKISHRYMEYYDAILQPYVDEQIALLEIGVHKGASLLLWRDYFLKGTIAGIDIDLPKGFVPGERISVFEGNQADTRFLSEVTAKVAPKGFDIIIDDGSHIGELTKKSFWHLFDNCLKPGGIYVIEDWELAIGMTGLTEKVLVRHHLVRRVSVGGYFPGWVRLRRRIMSRYLSRFIISRRISFNATVMEWSAL